MAKKKKSSNRNNVNWNNAKVQAVISYIQLGENRITKAEIMSLANKDIYYQLKNSGYIKESEKGHYIGTKKLHSHVAKLDNSYFSSSGSKEHSQKLRDSLSLLPKSVFERRDFKSSYDIEKQFNRTTLKSQEYKESLIAMKQNTYECLARLNNSYNTALERCASDYEKYNLHLSYIKEKEHYESQLSYLSEKPYLTPDYQVTLTEQERYSFIDNLESYREHLDERSPAYDYYTESINKLKALADGTVTVNIEIITNSYGNREIALHENFEVFTGTPQIFLM